MTASPFALKLVALVATWSSIEAQSVQLSPSGTIDAVKGDVLNIWCSAKEDIYERLEWFHANRSRVTRNEKYRVRTVAFRHSNLDFAALVFNPFFAVDASSYFCCGISNSDLNCEKVTVNVSDGYPPKFKSENVSYDFVEGDTVDLQCEASGLPRPEYTWVDNFGRSLHNDTGNWNVSTEGWLRIYSINSSQEGNYTCVATNRHGKATKLFLINLLRGYPPRFRNDSVSYEYEYGDDVYLECQAEGKPRPEYIWLDYMGRSMHNNNRKWNASTEGWLSIQSIERSLSGTCVAKNSYGTASQTFVIKQSRNVKLNVTVRELWRNLVRFAITFPVKNTDYRYVLTMFSHNVTGNKWDTVRWSIGEDYLLTSLKPGKTYTFIFGVKKTRYTDDILLNNTKLELTLPSFSPLLVVKKLQDGRIDIEFPSQTYYEINGYLKPLYFILRYVQLQQKSGTFYEKGCPINIEIPACFGRKYVIQALSSGSYYKLQLSAMLQDGPSEKSEIIVLVP